ncbi:unnamed protein product [Hapterophycus canaliculatus]
MMRMARVKMKTCPTTSTLTLQRGMMGRLKPVIKTTKTRTLMVMATMARRMAKKRRRRRDSSRWRLRRRERRRRKNWLRTNSNLRDRAPPERMSLIPWKNPRMRPKMRKTTRRKKPTWKRRGEPRVPKSPRRSGWKEMAGTARFSKPLRMRATASRLRMKKATTNKIKNKTRTVR